MAFREFVTFERYAHAISAFTEATGRPITTLIGPLEDKHCFEIGDNPHTICSYCKQMKKCGKVYQKKCAKFEGV